MLDTREGLAQGGDTGAAIEPGKPDESLLVEAIRYTDPDLKMPPKGGQLPDQQVADFVEWIRRGAPDPRSGVEKGSSLAYGGVGRQHWSFLPPRPQAPPPVSDPAWCRTPIDAFVLAKLEQNGMRPNPAADRRTLIRRVTFDLTGLPPTEAEVGRFPGRPLPRRLRAGRRPPAGLAPLRRALGPLLDGRGALRRHQGRPRQAAAERPAVSGRLDLPGLPDRRFQLRQALQPIHPRAARGRPGAHAPTGGGQAGQGGGDRDRPAVDRGAGLPHARKPIRRLGQRHHQRPDRCDHQGVSRPHRELRPVPRPQVRSDPAGRLLLALRRLRQHLRGDARVPAALRRSGAADRGPGRLPGEAAATGEAGGPQ